MAHYRIAGSSHFEVQNRLNFLLLVGCFRLSAF